MSLKHWTIKITIKFMGDCVICNLIQIAGPRNYPNARCGEHGGAYSHYEPVISNCAICNVKIVTSRGPMRIICGSCRERHMRVGRRYLQGMDFAREIRRVIGGHVCELCGRKWKAGMRRFDVHHPNDDNKKTRKYEKIGDLLNAVILCHKCHMRLPETRNKMRVIHSGQLISISMI